MSSNDRTVYSTEVGRICPTCGAPQSECRCSHSPQTNTPGDGIVRVFRDSKQRGGKTVTIIKGLPTTGQQLHDLLSSLKRTCGSGGTIKAGTIEIQGDHRTKIIAELNALGYKAKIAGG